MMSLVIRIIKNRRRVLERIPWWQKPRFWLADLCEILGYLIFYPWIYWRTEPLPSPEKVKKILVIRLDHLGDVLMTTPLLQALRYKFPGAKIAVMLSPWAKEILNQSPLVDDILDFNPPWHSSNHWCDFDLRAFVKLLKRIKHEGFDLVFNPRPNSYWDTILTFLTAIPQRIGTGYNIGTFLYNRFIIPSPSLDRDEHWVETSLRLLRKTYGDFPKFPTEIFISEEDRRIVDEQWEKLDISSPVFAIHPGVRDPIRDWDIDKFARLADILPPRFNCQVLLLGGTGDREKIEKIITRTESKPRFLAGLLTIPQMAEVIRRCKLLIGLESLSGHLAAAVGTMVFVIYGGLTHPDRFSPYTDNKVIIQKIQPCSPCWSRGCAQPRCLSEIEVEDVVAQIELWLKSNG